MDEKQLEKHVLDLMRASDNQCRYTNTYFLSLAEQDICLRLFRTERYFGYRFAGKASFENDGTERRIAVFGKPEELGYEFEIPIKVIKISPLSEKFADDLTHRDFLGAVLNLGIDRSLTGDIVIRGKTAWMYCLEQAAEFICDQLVQVKHTHIKCEIVSVDVPELEPQFQELRLNVASERLDALIAAFINKSRTNAVNLIKAQKVFINGRMMISGSASLKDGDVISVRGFGKCIYCGIEHETKKGRLYVTVKKYI